MLMERGKSRAEMLRYIAMINSQGVFWDNGEKLPISRQNREIIQKEYIRGLEKFVHGCRI